MRIREEEDPQAVRGEHIGTGQDRSGSLIDVFWQTDFDRPNRGFIAHRATAWRGDACLGYLRADYVGAEAYKAHNPTVWTHFTNFGGMCSGLRDGQDPRYLTGEAAANFRKNALHALKLYNHEDPGSYAAFEAIAKKTSRFKELMKSRKDFFAFHLEKPYVGYVDVGQNERSPFITEDSRGQGVGKILYCATAVALDRMGLPFHASGLQQPEATALWTRMTELGWTEDVPVGERTRRRLIADRIPESVFRQHAQNDIGFSF